ncbi:MAG: hypothetical protein RL617_447, partial [Pseudomonadota bacterium]
SWVTTEQDHPTWDHSTTQDAIELIEPHAPAGLLAQPNIREPLDARTRSKARSGPAATQSRLQRVPIATAIALALPLGEGLAARLAYKCQLLFCHATSRPTTVWVRAR